MTLDFRDVMNILVVIIGAAYAVGQFRERMRFRDWKEWRKAVEDGLKKMSELTGKVQTLCIEGREREIRIREHERRLNAYDANIQSDRHRSGQ